MVSPPLVLEALKLLSRRDDKVLRLRYGIGGATPLTPEAVGKSLDISRQRVSQIEQRALSKLGKVMWENLQMMHPTTDVTQPPDGQHS